MTHYRPCLVLDIETKSDDAYIEDPEVRGSILEHIKAPANYKDPTKIAEYRLASFDEKIERAALSPMLGRIVAIGFAPLEELDAAPIVNHDEDECELLHAFAKGLEMCGRSVITGWNVRRFDIPFIVARCALHDVKLPDWWPHMRSYTGIVDAMEVLDPDHHYKLKHWLKRFGLPAKTEDGSEVKNMTIQEIADYCANDVIVERLLVRKVMGFCPALFTHAYGEN